MEFYSRKIILNKAERTHRFERTIRTCTPKDLINSDMVEANQANFNNMETGLKRQTGSRF